MSTFLHSSGYRLSFHVLFGILLTTGMEFSRLEAAEPPLIPRPVFMALAGESLALPHGLNLQVLGDDLESVASTTRRYLEERGSLAAAETGVPLVLQQDAAAFGGTPEAYRLTIGPEEVRISAATPAGIFYGVQTLLQLLPAEEEGPLELPQLAIADQPRFRWRGMHLDVSRHFFGVEEVKRFLDHLARYKMNVFHWHLTDGPGWRLQIDRYPRLTEIGAWRVDKRADGWNWRDTELAFEGRQPDSYGGFYAKDEVREILVYAAERHILVVPEIEMPGHSYAPLVAYPQYACEGNDIRVQGLRGEDVFCVGNEGTFSFLRQILDEVIELFPGPYVHIGADEVPKTAWKRCGKCQKRMQEEGMTQEAELQTYFVRRMEAYLHAKGKKMIGWDEVIVDGLPSRATAMIWRDASFARSALEQGLSVVMSPGSHCYFDQYQSQSREGESPAIGGYLPAERVYAFDPILPDTPEVQRSRVLGGQGNLWTEYIPSEDVLEERMFPRMPALSEALWTPLERKDWDSFSQRLQHHQADWRRQGIRFFGTSL